MGFLSVCCGTFYPGWFRWLFFTIRLYLQYQYFFFRKSCFLRFITIYWPAIFIGEVYYYNHIQVLLFNIYHENNINLSN